MMKISKKRLTKIIKEELVNELGGFAHDKYHNITGTSGQRPKKSDNDDGIDLYQGFSSKEAKKVVDDGLRNYAKILRKAQYKVIKDWMSKAKTGVIDYFDLVRGMQTGDISRAYPYETKFLMSVLNKDKIIDRFRKYFGGKKGKKGRKK